MNPAASKASKCNQLALLCNENKFHGCVGSDLPRKRTLVGDIDIYWKELINTIVGLVMQSQRAELEGQTCSKGGVHDWNFFFLGESLAPAFKDCSWHRPGIYLPVLPLLRRHEHAIKLGFFFLFLLLYLPCELGGWNSGPYSCMARIALQPISLALIELFLLIWRSLMEF